MVQKKKRIIIIIAVAICLVIGLPFVILSEINRDKEKSKSLIFDFGLTDRLGEGYVRGTPEQLLSSEYNKSEITEEFMGYESITSFLPEEATFETSMYFAFHENRSSIDAVNKFVYELFFEAEFLTTTDCDELWNSTSHLIIGQQNIPPQEVDDLFIYPALVFQYNISTEFKYCLRTSEKKIAFITFEAIESTTNLVFDKDYQPDKTLWESSFPENLIRFDGAFFC